MSTQECPLLNQELNNFIYEMYVLKMTETQRQFFAFVLAMVVIGRSAINCVPAVFWILINQ